MIKELARSALSTGSRLGGLLALYEARMAGKLTILCYHRVLKSPQKAAYFGPDLVVTPEAFAVHCRTLAEVATVLPLAEAYAQLKAGERTRKPLVAITFDDGYFDNYEHAAPALAAHGLRATFFAIADLTGTDASPWYDRMARAVQGLMRQGRGVSEQGQVLFSTDFCASPHQVVRNAKQLSSLDRGRLLDTLLAEAGADADTQADRLMSWHQLRDLSRQGHEIGSHSCTHEILPLLDDASLAHEVRASKQKLESALGVEVKTLCYPNGDFDVRTTRLAKEHGYLCAVTTQNGLNDRNSAPYELKRRFIHEGRLSHPFGLPSSTQLRMEISGLADVAYRRHTVATSP